MQLFDKLFWQEKVSFIATSTSFDVQQVGEIFLRKNIGTGGPVVLYLHEQWF